MKATKMSNSKPQSIRILCGAAASKIKTGSEGRFSGPSGAAARRNAPNCFSGRPEKQFFNLDPQNLTFSKSHPPVCGRQLLTGIWVILSHNKVQYNMIREHA